MDRDRSTGAALIWTIRAPTSCPASCTARSRCRGYRRASESVSPGLDLRIDVGVQGLSGGGGPSGEEVGVWVEPPIGIEPMTYALRDCSHALLTASKPARASCSQVAAGGDRWLLMAARGARACNA